MGTVMISYNTWNGVQAHGSRRLMTDILKGDLGFKGFLISDWAAIDAIPGDYKSDVETSINAGLDMVMVPDKYIEFYNTLKSLVEEGASPWRASTTRCAASCASRRGWASWTKGPTSWPTAACTRPSAPRSIARSPATRSASRWCS